jgi:hypothetical protein
VVTRFATEPDIADQDLGKKLLIINFTIFASTTRSPKRLPSFQVQDSLHICRTWYVTNYILHKDLRIPQVRTLLQELIDTYRSALQSHTNPLMAQILTQPDSRRL